MFHVTKRVVVVPNFEARHLPVFTGEFVLPRHLIMEDYLTQMVKITWQNRIDALSYRHARSIACMPYVENFLQVQATTGR
jgi:hypothetical protein